MQTDRVSGTIIFRGHCILPVRKNNRETDAAIGFTFFLEPFRDLGEKDFFFLFCSNN